MKAAERLADRRAHELHGDALRESPRRPLAALRLRILKAARPSALRSSRADAASLAPATVKARTPTTAVSAPSSGYSANIGFGRGYGFTRGQLLIVCRLRWLDHDRVLVQQPAHAREHTSDVRHHAAGDEHRLPRLDRKQEAVARSQLFQAQAQCERRALLGARCCESCESDACHEAVVAPGRVRRRLPGSSTGIEPASPAGAATSSRPAR